MEAYLNTNASAAMVGGSKKTFFLTGYSTCNVLYPICDRTIRMTSMYTAYRDMKFIHLNNLMSENRSKAWVISRLTFSLDLNWILILHS